MYIPLFGCNEYFKKIWIKTENTTHKAVFELIKTEAQTFQTKTRSLKQRITHHIFFLWSDLIRTREVRPLTSQKKEKNSLFGGVPAKKHMNQSFSQFSRHLEGVYKRTKPSEYPVT